MKQVYVVASVDETDIGKIALGMPAYITPDAFPDKKLVGSVERIAPKSKVEQNVTVFEVTALVDNGDDLLKSGMNSTVEVVTDQAENAILVPVRAVEYRAPQMPGSADTAHGGLRAEGMRGGRDSSGWRGQGGRRESGADGQGGGGQVVVMRQSGPGGGGMQMSHGGQRGGGMPMVQVRKNGLEEWVRVKPGLSNVDEIQILEGLAEGDTVVYSLSSGAMQARNQFMDRMRTNNAIPGMRRTN